jgi:hypothetical protein
MLRGGGVERVRPRTPGLTQVKIRETFFLFFWI